MLLATLQVQLRCRQQLLRMDMTLGEVQQQLWKPHAVNGQILQIALDRHAAEEAPG